MRRSLCSRELRDEGVVTTALRRVEQPCVFLLVHADTATVAASHLARLPFVAEGLLAFDIVEVAEI